MIIGASTSGHLPSSLLTNPRPAVSGANPPATKAIVPDNDSPVSGGGDDIFRQYQTLDLAARQFSQLLPRIEALGFQIE